LRALRSAERLVAVRGFAGVRLSDVALDAGVSIGSLQHHFETRDRLLREAFLLSAEEHARESAAAAAGVDDPWERVVAMLARALHEDDFPRQAALWIEFCAVAGRDDEIRAVMADVYDQWRGPLRAAIEDGVAAGLFHPSAPVEVVVDLLLAQIDGLAVAGTVDPDALPVTQLRELLLTSARMMLRVEPRPERD
jgi:AcrR family transcriptional regulator